MHTMHQSRTQMRKNKHDSENRKVAAFCALQKLGQECDKKIFPINHIKTPDDNNAKRKNDDTNEDENNYEEPPPKRIKIDFKYPLNGEEKTTETPPVFGVLTKVQQKQLKKLLVTRMRLRKDRAKLEFNEIGVAADLITPPEKRKPLHIDDFQHFIIFSVLHVLSNSKRGLAKWVQFLKSGKVKHRIFLIIDGTGLNDYLKNEAHLKALCEFESRLEVVTPFTYGRNLIQEIALVSLTSRERYEYEKEYGSVKLALKNGELEESMKTYFNILKPKELSKSTIQGKKNKNVEETKNKTVEETQNTKKTKNKTVEETQNTKKNKNKNAEATQNKNVEENRTADIVADKFSRKLLLMSAWEMIEADYPMRLPGNCSSEYNDYVFTRTEYEEVSDNSPMWSLDCEMCMTKEGNELTRICIINEAHEIVYETLVKPNNYIFNYLTKYSGITEKMLRNVTTKLEHVQKHIRAICPPNVIFIGQSLNGDLKALKMLHPYVIDTSLIFNLTGVKHLRTKLSILTEEFLSERIQTAGKLGHNPIEDALAAMKLVQAKLQHSIGWGNAALSGPRPQAESDAARLLLESRTAMGSDKLKGLVDYSEKCYSAKENCANDYSRQEFDYNEMLSASLFSHLVRGNNHVHLIGKPLITNDWSQYINKSATSLVEITSASTSKAVVRLARKRTPYVGTTIAHISLADREPENAIFKADRLVEKFLKYTMPNTLYTVFLAGREGCPGNGVMFTHLVREHVPFVHLT